MPRRRCSKGIRLFFWLAQGVVLGVGSAAAGPKNAIFFIGDGMGTAQVTLGRIYQANARDGKLHLDAFERVAFIRTYATDRMVTDSAAAATALATGRKTRNGAIAQGPDGERLETVLEAAKARGLAVGIVTTTTVTHATPACFYAHVGSRAEEAEIAAQLIDYGQIDVIMGGGREFFLPQGAADEENGRRSSRRDDRDLVAEAAARGYRLIRRASELETLREELARGESPGKILALFSPGMMAYEIERHADFWGEPSLAEMTEVAIELLSRHPAGYFLMVEGGRIDHACHDNRAHAAAREMLAFDEAVGLAVSRTQSAGETLIVVTADHETGGLAINGYPAIEIGGEAVFTESAPLGPPDIITFATGPGADRAAMEGVERKASRYRQAAAFSASSAAHTGVDVPAWAAGPGSEAVKGTMDNSELGEVIFRALELRN